MSTIYLFDVDGTLTPSKAEITPSFKNFFKSWMSKKEVYIISGGSFERIVGQLGSEITDQCAGIFGCMGNIFLQRRELINPSGFDEWEIIYENTFKAPSGFYESLDEEVRNSAYPIKTGRHHEERVGMVNFSVVGRNANTTQRKAYAEYDAQNLERHAIVERLKEKYPKIDFVIGGAVSIDIFNIGNDKSQVIDRYFAESLEHNRIVFVGDRIAFPGNDHALSTALRQHPNGEAHEVETWEDTAELLKTEPFA
mgnify:CR=1 FL=1